MEGCKRRAATARSRGAEVRSYQIGDAPAAFALPSHAASAAAALRSACGCKADRHSRGARLPAALLRSDTGRARQRPQRLQRRPHRRSVRHVAVRRSRPSAQSVRARAVSRGTVARPRVVLPVGAAVDARARGVRLRDVGARRHVPDGRAVRRASARPAAGHAGQLRARAAGRLPGAVGERPGTTVELYSIIDRPRSCARACTVCTRGSSAWSTCCAPAFPRCPPVCSTW